VVPLGALLLAGCITVYQQPGPGQPAALIKVRSSYDHARARALIPPGGWGGGASLQVLLREGRNLYLLAERRLPGLLTSADPAPLETLTARLRPDGPAAVEVRFEVGWLFDDWQWVTHDRMVTRTVTRAETSYDAASSSFQTRDVTTTEVVNEPEQVWERVTRSGSAGCTAAVALTPREGEVYLVDYVNLAVDKGCSATGFQQAPAAEGTFTLRRLP
jgi:hypothetical protein